MDTSNKLFKTYILNQVKLVRASRLTPLEGLEGVKGYYKALLGQNAVDELTSVYRELAEIALRGSESRAKQANTILTEGISFLGLSQLIQG